MRRIPLTAAAVLAATLVALSALPLAAQDPSPAPTPPPRQFPRAQIAVVTNELEDPAMIRAVTRATTAATEGIGANAPTVIPPLPEENVLIAARDFGEEDFEYDVVVVSGIGGPETIDISRDFPNTVYVGVGQGLPCVNEDGLPDPSGTCAGDAATLLRNYISSAYAVDQAGYLAGVVAASTSRSGRIGAIAGWPGCTDCNRYIGGFSLGVRSVDPDITIQVAYLTDLEPGDLNPEPESGRAFAEAFIDVYELDMLLAASGGSSSGVIQAACDAGILAIGTDVDRAVEHPRLARCILTSAYRNVADPIAEAVYGVARQFRDEVVFTGGGQEWDLDNGGVGLAPYYELASSVPVEVPNRLEEARSGIRSGRVHTCPDDCGEALSPES
ncbi:hypothetical protein BH23CHL8_BH23CHL8_24750 [soil metagenome]